VVIPASGTGSPAAKEVFCAEARIFPEAQAKALEILMNLKDLKRIVLNTDGASWEPTRGSHFVVKLNGVRICTVPGTGSDHRSMKNTIAQLRRGGIDIPRK
jgi:hypothetical protein